MIILVDMDGPLADFEKGFFEKWRAQFPDESSVSIDQRRTFYIRDDYPQELRDKIESIYTAPGFYLGLPPVAGSVEALKEMVRLGYDVRICTSPLSRYENCVLEKYQWIERHLGKDFTRRIILSRDKTIVRGKFLIDDKPVIEGDEVPEWEHVLYDCSYNREVQGKKRLTWANWKEVLCITRVQSCAVARVLVAKIHTFDKALIDSIDSNDRKSATEHIGLCEECKLWFYEKMCDMAYDRLDREVAKHMGEEDEDSLEDYITAIHLKIHEELGDYDYCRTISC